ncbi:hypothetical protein HanXRQr2_Chr02g0086251 [Helianthus annuus]|uniref:Uncharacterized protein n=1 Tax=Helianthus annuus TaxID=4232 RepID=A0A9K3JRW0_HELAN|nr:hypothetical protein HanXRQr2_Chr02g0086251 [Helianthus annuus]KAJ0620283.1 hypothetical protein HanHA89_Chr02g0080561 [Helianthus annuus]KAJ0787692.1 hypothetical protein HanOQP8_Chr02g0085161 [Helianthus annuus]
MDCFRSPTRFLISTIVIVLYVSSLQFQYTGFDCHFACIVYGFFILKMDEYGCENLVKINGCYFIYDERV